MYLPTEAYSEVYRLVLHAQKGVKNGEPANNSELNYHNETDQGEEGDVSLPRFGGVSSATIDGGGARKKTAVASTVAEQDASRLQLHSPLHSSISFSGDAVSNDLLAAGAVLEGMQDRGLRMQSPTVLRKGKQAASPNSANNPFAMAHAFSDDSGDDTSRGGSRSASRRSSFARSPAMSRRMSTVSWTTNEVHEVESGSEYDRSAVDDHMRSSNIRSIISEVKKFVNEEMKVHPSSPSASEGSLIPVKNRARANIIADIAQTAPQVQPPARAKAPSPADFPSNYSMMM